MEDEKPKKLKKTLGARGETTTNSTNLGLNLGCRGGRLHLNKDPEYKKPCPGRAGIHFNLDTELSSSSLTSTSMAKLFTSGHSYFTILVVSE